MPKWDALLSDEEREGHGEKGSGADESQKKRDGDPVHLLRHPHGECGAAGGAVDGATTGGGRIVEPLKRFRNGVLTGGLQGESGKTTRNPGDGARTRRPNSIKRRV